MLGVDALLERDVVKGAIEGRDWRSPFDDVGGSLAVRGGVGIPLEYPSLERVRCRFISSRC